MKTPSADLWQLQCMEEELPNYHICVKIVDQPDSVKIFFRKTKIPNKTIYGF